MINYGASYDATFRKDYFIMLQEGNMGFAKMSNKGSCPILGTGNICF